MHVCVYVYVGKNVLERKRTRDKERESLGRRVCVYVCVCLRRGGY